MNKLLFMTFIVLALISCGSDRVHIPKPRAFPKIDFPKRTFQNFKLDKCNFSFEYPNYAFLKKDKAFFDLDKSSQCWFDMIMPVFNGSLHCTHYEIASTEQFEELVADAFEMVGKHHIKADFRDEFVISTDHNVGGVLFELHGPVACPLQFYLTDSTSHFLRGALYFNNQVAPDSMAPIHNFVKADVLKMIESMEWN